jgi:putative transposase
VADDLKSIYQAPTVEQAEKSLESFANKWDASHPSIAKSWRNNWERIIPLFSYPTDIRKAIYTTNSIESLNMSLRKITKNRGHFPSDEAMFKLIYLGIEKHCEKVDMPIRDWKSALNQFSIIFEGLMPRY